MGDMKSYILSILLSALMCAIVKKILIGSGVAATVAKALCSIFMVLSLTQPFFGFSIPDWDKLVDGVASEADSAVSVGVNYAGDMQKAIITRQLQTYIMDKAAQYDASISVDITLSDDPMPVPVTIAITGSISPYGKRQLQTVIEQYLGVSKENQQWISG